GLDLHDLAQGAGAVVELPVAERAGPGDEAAGGAVADLDLEGDLVAAARALALAGAPEDALRLAVFAQRRGVALAEDLLQVGQEEGVGVVGRPDEEEALVAQDVPALLDHVDLEGALAAAGGQVDGRGVVPRQVPEVGGDDDLGLEAALGELGAQALGLE